MSGSSLDSQFGSRPDGSKLQLALSVGLPLLLVVAQAIFFWDFGIDDVGISWRYARHLADGHGLTWNLDGPPVEGYSNFLWVLIIAVPGALGADVALASKSLGVVFAAANMVIFAVVLKRLLGDLRFWWTPLWIVAVMPEWVAWSVSGLEISLYGTFLLIALLAFTGHSRRSALLLSIAIAGLVLTRPEGFAVAAVILALRVLLMRGESIRTRWNTLRAPLVTLVLTLAGLVGFRLWYFGYPLPNTVYAKFSTLFPSLPHVGRWMLFVAPFAVAAIVVLTARGGSRPGGPIALRRSYGVVLMVAWATAFAHTLMILPVYPVMNFLHRYHVAFLPFWLLAVPIVLNHLAERRLIISITATVFLVAWSAQGWPSVYERFRVEQYQQRVQRCIVDALRELPGNPTIAIVDAGLIPYWSDLPTIDVWGLCDVEIAREKSRQASVMKRAPAVYITTVDSLVYGIVRPRLGDDKLMYQSGNFSSVYRLWRPCVGGERHGQSSYDYAILVLARWARDNGVRIPERRKFWDTAPAE